MSTNKRSYDEQYKLDLQVLKHNSQMLSIWRLPIQLHTFAVLAGVQVSRVLRVERGDAHLLKPDEARRLVQAYFVSAPTYLHTDELSEKEQFAKLSHLVQCRATWFKQIRLTANLSQDHLGGISKTHQKYISRVEHGQTNGMGLEALRRIVETYERLAEKINADRGSPEACEGDREADEPGSGG